MSFLPGMFPAGAVAGAVQAANSFNGTVQNPSGSGTAIGTYSGVPFGTPDATRLVVIVANSFDFPQTTPMSATIAGVSATIHVNTDDGLANVSIMSASVPSGASGNVVITYDSNITLPSIYAVRSYSLYNLLSSTPEDTAFSVTPSTDTLSINIDITGPDGVLICGAYVGSNTATWSGASEDSDISSVATTAHEFALATETPRAVSVTSSGSIGTDAILVGVSWA